AAEGRTVTSVVVAEPTGSAAPVVAAWPAITVVALERRPRPTIAVSTAVATTVVVTPEAAPVTTVTPVTAVASETAAVAAIPTIPSPLVALRFVVGRVGGHR
ncbi:hypothetical protein KWI83_37850, partial [Streptomyces sp. TRM70350]|nr:hypothetical protein [Streptomyces sp. TRM70350]